VSTSVAHLVKLEQEPKIRDCSAEALQGLMQWLIDLVDMKILNEDDFDRQVLVIGQVLKLSYGKFTISEVKNAFLMALEGKFEGVQLYQKIDAVTLSKVLIPYRKWRDNKLKNERNKPQQKPEPSQEEKDKIILNGIRKEFEFFKENGGWKYSLTENLIHDIHFKVLEKVGVIQLSRSQKESILDKAKQAYERSMKLKMAEKELPSEKRSFKAQIDRVSQESKTKTIKSIAQKIAFRQFIERLVNAEEDINEYLEL